MTAAANRPAGNHNARRVRSAHAKVPRKSKAKASASVKLYSPAMLLARLPPMMCWLNEIVFAIDAAVGDRFVELGSTPL